MKTHAALLAVAGVTVGQWGMVTTAQAGALGVSRLVLSRLAEAGHLERLAHGVYKDAGVPTDQYDDLRAAWLSTDPTRLAEHRLDDGASGVVVASTSAATLYGMGDFWADRHEFVAPLRRQSQRSGIRFRRRVLDSRDVTVVQGLPAMRVEKTLTDLLDDVGDQSLVADTLRDALKNHPVNLERLGELLAPLAEKNGFKRTDGTGLLEKLLEGAGADVASVARRIARDPELGARVVAEYASLGLGAA
jgi:predicted transcriptional regulator of viral defense system